MDLTLKDVLFDIMTDKDVSYEKKIELVGLLHTNPSMSPHHLKQMGKREGSTSKFNDGEEMGMFGNVWVRKVAFNTKHERMKGHKHHHDHISLLATGSVMAYIEGQEPKKFVAPTFITVKAEHEHYFIPLEDETVSFCVFALRDEAGEVTDFYDEKNGWQYNKVEG